MSEQLRRRQYKRIAAALSPKKVCFPIVFEELFTAVLTVQFFVHKISTFLCIPQVLCRIIQSEQGLGEITILGRNNNVLISVINPG